MESSIKLTLIAGGEDRQRLLDDGWDAIEQFALTGDRSYIEKIYEIDDRLAPRGQLDSVPAATGENPVPLDESDWFSVTETGELQFTEEGLKEFRSYFGQAGIDIRTIRTYPAYLDARRQASPYFMDWLAQRARNGGLMTLDRRALIAAVEADDATFERLLGQLDTRRRLRIVNPQASAESEFPD